MPTRVIDLGPPGESATPKIFVTSKKLGKYIALSYCWGNDVKHEIKLKNSTYMAMLDSIDEVRLTKTHQEALRVARNLGFRYVWIDALCIIQDNEKDWETESSRMTDVYGNAELTLAAGRVRESTRGFLEHQTISALKPYRMEYDPSTPPPASQSECYISLPRSHNIGPLQERAWCFQKGILSRRSLVYGADQISLQCQQRVYWEDGHAEEVPANSDRRIVLGGPGIQIRDMAETKEAVLLRWYFMLIEYTGRNMFDPHDVFAALMGLAKAVQQSVRCRYLAGLWEDDMIKGLLWVGRCSVLPVGLPEKKYHPLKRPLERNTKKPHLLGQLAIRAPSWSWASVEGAIFYGYSYTFPEPEEFRRKYRTPADICLRPALQNPDRWTAQDGCGVNEVRMPT